jgi:uncharacterized protein YndB with AHSA1/START domain
METRPEIRREILLPTTREDAWDALTDPDRLEDWFANEVELDLREGGAAVFRWGDGDVRRAVVETVEDEERLVLRFEDDGLVDLRLADDESGTRVLVHETAPQWSTALAVSALASWAHA